jgi:hypothetical protein
MNSEHEEAGELLFRLREITNNYTPPVDACNSHIVMLSKLEELDTDLNNMCIWKKHFISQVSSARNGNNDPLGFFCRIKLNTQILPFCMSYGRIWVFF